MRRYVLVIGVILVCIGVPLMYFGNSSREVTDLLGSRQSDLYQSSITYEYLKGEKLSLRMATGKDWYMWAQELDEFMQGGQFIPLVPVDITIIDPNKHLTKLEAEYGVIQNTEALALYVVKVIEKSDGLSLKTFNRTWTVGNNNYTSEYLFEADISGIAEVDGTYNATVIQLEALGDPITKGAANRLTLYRYSVSRVYDYWYLLPLGAAVSAVGSIAAVFAGLTTPRKTHAKPAR